MGRFILYVFVFFLFPSFALAQRGSPNFSLKKPKVRKEYVFAIGACNFLGELGGANGTGTNFIKDLELSATRPSLAVGLRHKFLPRLALKGGIYYQLLSGSDNLTKEPFRHNRNLSFRSHIFELSAQAEFYLTPEKANRLYKIKKSKGVKNYDIEVYVFLGLGGFYFNPQARYMGDWVNLQPIGTEGQGLNGGPKKYSLISVCIPYGIGAKYIVDRDLSVGLEIGIRKTFTDYIDDVSTVYYDNDVILSERGQVAAYLADPSLYDYPAEYGGDGAGLKQTSAGQQRGDPKDKDSYMFINVTVAYKMPNKRKTRSKF